MNSATQQAGSADLLADLVFEGGGVKGIGLAGAYRELSDRGYRPQCVAGTSAGAITAALVAVGYTGGELEQVALHDMKFQEFADPTFLDRLGAPGGALQFMKSRGLHSGKYFMDWMSAHLERKGITKFGQLRDASATDERRRYRLRVIASDLSGRSMLVLPEDAKHLGIEPDELEIAYAVRMSMSIPIFFEPVVHEGSQRGQQHVIVDGGLLSNYPIWLFDTTGAEAPRFPTFGMLLVAPGQDAPLLPDPAGTARMPRVGSNIAFLKAIAETVMEAHDRLYVEQANYARTIPIPTLGVKTTQFDISPGQAQALFDSGKAAAAQFLDAWDFQAYIQKFRSGALPTRREVLLDAKP